jgi:hypothetical protein
MHANDRVPVICKFADRTLILGVGSNAPVDTVSCFVSRAFNKSLSLALALGRQTQFTIVY